MAARTVKKAAAPLTSKRLRDSRERGGGSLRTSLHGSRSRPRTGRRGRLFTRHDSVASDSTKREDAHGRRKQEDHDGQARA